MKGVELVSVWDIMTLMQHLEKSLLGTGRVQSAAASAVHSLPLSGAVPFAVG